jgi:hypothetical protein
MIDEPPTTERRWIGCVEFDVTSPGGSRIGCLELALTSDQVEVTYQDRPMGSVARAKLRAWLQQPRDPFRFEQIRLSAHGRSLYVSLGLAPPVLMPVDVTRQLQAVV